LFITPSIPLANIVSKASLDGIADNFVNTSIDVSLPSTIPPLTFNNSYFFEKSAIIFIGVIESSPNTTALGPNVQ
jgi:hypothetical protein